jgi:phosphoribosylanthranilate isomerase
MKKFRVKLCGVTRASDARLAARLGVDLIGLIFYPDSPRAVTVERAKEIVRELPPTVSRVGVFVNSSPGSISRIAQEAGLDYVQLHGEEPEEHVIRLGTSGCRVIKRFEVQNADEYESLYKSPADIVIWLAG